MWRRVFLVFVLLRGAPACAGAFMQPSGQGQIISQLAFSEAGRAYDSFGRGAAIPAWRKFELSSYGEYGVADWLTIVGEPSWFSFHAPTPRPSTWFGPLGGRTISRVGVAEAGARMRLFEWGDSVLSAQATGRYAAGGGAAEPYIDMGRRAQADVRLLLGRKFEMMGLAGYTDMQVAFRSRGPFGNQLRFDMTIAVRPFERTMLMLQSFTILTPGRLDGGFALSQKLQGSMLFDVTDWLSLQVGGLTALRGVSSAAEKGIVSGVWLRF